MRFKQTRTDRDRAATEKRLEELQRQGFAMFQQKRYAEALAALDETVELRRRLQGNEDPAVGTDLLNRGRMYRLLERNAECEADYREALDILRRYPEGAHEQIIWLLSNLCALFKNTDRAAEVEPFARELLGIYRETLPANSTRLAEVMVDLAGACIASGKVPEALRLLQEALQIRTAALGPEDPDTVVLRQVIASIAATGEATAPLDPAAEPQAPDAQPSPEQQFQGCLAAFAARDYRSAAGCVYGLLEAGVVFHSLIQLLLISLQRAGEEEGVRKVAEQVPEIASGVPWERGLLQLTLGQADPNALLSQAEDDEQRGQVYYYAAARLITVGQPEVAVDLLRGCIELQHEGMERILAAVELGALERQPPDSAPRPPSGPDHRSVEAQVAALSAKATELFQQGNTSEALPLFEQIAGLRRQAYGATAPDYGVALSDLGAVYLAAQNLDGAEAAQREALQILEPALGATHPATLTARRGLADVLTLRGDFESAASLYRQVLAAEKAAGLHRSAEWAEQAVIQARYVQAQGDRSGAEGLFKDALDVYREMPGAPGAITDTLELLVRLLIEDRRFGDATSYVEELLGSLRSSVGERDAGYARALEYLGQIVLGQGDYRQAERLWGQSLEIYAGAPEGQAAGRTLVLSRLGGLQRSLGRLEEAQASWQQALDLARSQVPPDQDIILQLMNNQALLLGDQGKFAEAEAIFRSVLGNPRPVSRAFRASLKNNLAMLYRSAGRFGEAEQLLLEVLEGHSLRGERDPQTIMFIANLGLLYCDMGLYGQAEPLLREAVDARQEVLPAGNPDLAQSLSNLGELYRATGRMDAAKALLEQAVETWQAGGAENSLGAATALNNLALIASERYEWDHAEALFRRSLAAKRALFGEQHPDVATSLDTLAEMYRSVGRHADAEPLCRQALSMRRELLGDTHPDVAWSLGNLARICVATGRAGEALDLLCESSDVDDRLIGQVFALAGEEQRLAFLERHRSRLEVFLSLVHTYLNDRPDAVHEAFDLVLRRKAIGAEALAAQRDAVLGGHYPDLRPRLQELASLRRQVAEQTLAGPAASGGADAVQEHRKRLAELTARQDRLEADLVRRIPEMNLQQALRKADRRQVAAALPAGSALVEFVRFDRFDFLALDAPGERQWRPARYLAFVCLAGRPDGVQLIDLGEAEPIERLLSGFRASITGGGRGLRPVAAAPSSTAEDDAALRRAVFDPLLPALAGANRLFLAPDGDLARLPFETLPAQGAAADSRRLIDDYHLSYLSVGRDILRFSAPRSVTPAAELVIANPNFNLHAVELEVSAAVTPASDESLQARGRGQQSRDLDPNALHFNDLPGTQVEGERVAVLLGVQPWLGEDALEGRLTTSPSPRILHIATHGYFLEDQDESPYRARPLSGYAANLPGSGFRGRLSYAMENPLLRSGLALAGANTWLRGGALTPEADDGLLNAVDVSGLDLLATELVVLSACETALGLVRLGEGVFGLRRSFVQAGARTLVMSLWRVPDQQTQELMVDFYGRILRGEGRAEALRSAQLALKARFPEPYYWGAFICQGDPSTLATP